MTISEYVKSAEWVNLYSEKMRGHLTSFFYNLFVWLEEANADTLELRDKEIIWSKNEVVIGNFPITTPNPNPGFGDMLLFILNNDKVIGKHLYRISDTALIFHFDVK
jgi:hypothetical protein